MNFIGYQMAAGFHTNVTLVYSLMSHFVLNYRLVPLEFSPTCESLRKKKKVKSQRSNERSGDLQNPSERPWPP